MGKPYRHLMICGCAFAALSACNKSESDTPAAPNAAVTEDRAADPIQSAMAAAPESIGRDATIVQAGADGSMKTLRAGNNGWTCMPDNPQTPGNDPMCMDANAMNWAAAWMGHKTPPANSVGLMYMLKGGSDASNTDPYGQKPADGKWVDTGPHVMVVGAESLNKLYPASASPDTSKPYVMFGGTPYAHVMVPIK
ncbi:MAG: hypothetical protein ABIQ32_11180 [Sphingomicrobium sp.]